MIIRLRFAFSSVLELFVLLGACSLMLSACGGGGSGSNVNNNGGVIPNINTPLVPTQTGFVSAVFSPNGAGQQLFLFSRIGNTAANTSSFVQAAGVMTSLYNYAHSGSPAVTQELAGDSNYTIGRWVWGTVTDTSTNMVVDTMNGSMANTGWHYVLVNKLSTLQTAGSMVCDTGTFTHPTYNNGNSGANLAITTGSNATLSFSPTGANFSFSLATSLGGTTHTLNFSNTNVGLGYVGIGNGFGNGFAGGYGALSDGGGGAIRISGIYADYRTVGIGYYGAYSFLCQ